MSNPYEKTHGIPPEKYIVPYLDYDGLVAALEYTSALPVALSSHSVQVGQIPASVGRALESVGVVVERRTLVRNPLIPIDEFFELTPQRINAKAEELAGPTCQRCGIGVAGDRAVRRALRFWQHPPLHLEEQAIQYGEALTQILRGE